MAAMGTKVYKTVNESIMIRKRLTLRPEQKKLSKQQKLILQLLREHKGRLPQRTLTRMVGERLGKIEHFTKQEAIDHGIKTVKEAPNREAAELLSMLITDNINKMPRRGYSYVTGSCRASVCRSIRRLEARSLVANSFIDGVYLADEYPDEYKRYKEMCARVEAQIKAETNG